MHDAPQVLRELNRLRVKNLLHTQPEIAQRFGFPAEMLGNLLADNFTFEHDGRQFILRNQATGCAGTVFQAVKVALPPLFRRVNPDGTDPPPRPIRKRPRKRRLTPRRRRATPD